MRTEIREMTDASANARITDVLSALSIPVSSWYRKFVPEDEHCRPGPNQLWQMDVTYIHIPGYGWQYAVTVIDYYSRYLLACYLTSSYCATEVLLSWYGDQVESFASILRESSSVTSTLSLVQ